MNKKKKLLSEENLQYMRRISKRYSEHHITAFSAQMAYFLFLSIFPFMMFLLSLAGRLNVDTQVMINVMERGMPADVSSLLGSFISSHIMVDSMSILSISGVMALWSASRAISGLIRSFNMAYGIVEKRNFAVVKLIGVAYTFMLVIAIITTLALPNIGSGFFDFLKTYITVPDYIIQMFYSVRIVLFIGVYILVIGSMHMVLPAERLYLKDIYIGAIFSIVGWYILSIVFNVFVSSFVNYTVVYGGLAAIVTLMIWMYAMSIVMMLGAEINSIILHVKEERKA